MVNYSLIEADVAELQRVIVEHSLESGPVSVRHSGIIRAVCIASIDFDDERYFFAV